MMKMDKNFDPVKINSELTYGTWRKQEGWNPLLIKRAEGIYFEDHNGKRYMDFSSQLMCSNLGHGNKEIIKAINDQLLKFEYAQPGYLSI
ncbi:MAG: aminotransferase class III-fold pyridoxal phosphate-dependent enzyme [Thermoplasmata archaeon]